MSGSPSEAEIQAQWRNWVDILEQTRNFADGSIAGGGNALDILEQSLEGEYTPDGLSTAAASYRAGLSSLVSPGLVLDFLTPTLFEYAKLLGYGSGYTTPEEIMRALYEHFHAGTLSVQSRNITFDTTATLGAGNIGDGAITRLTVDENGYDLEACHVEQKRFRCRADQNSLGLNKKHAEVFEHLGDTSSRDDLLRAPTLSGAGSGESSRTFITSKHAGSGEGGSLLRNSSFSTFSSTATPKFEGWDEAAGGAQLAQDTTNFFRGSPGTTDDASLQITGGAGTVTIKQTIDNLQRTSLDPDRPYFFRIMVNPDIAPAASGGSVTIRLGNQERTATITSLGGGGWQEMLIGPGIDNWFRKFNEDPLDLEIEWSGSASGTLHVDDAIFCPWDLIDGTFWVVTGGATPWLVDDTLSFTDTGGLPATAKIQWWLFISGLGYLPSTTGTPTFADP